MITEYDKVTDELGDVKSDQPGMTIAETIAAADKREKGLDVLGKTYTDIMGTRDEGGGDLGAPSAPSTSSAPSDGGFGSETGQRGAPSAPSAPSAPAGSTALGGPSYGPHGGASYGPHKGGSGSGSGSGSGGKIVCTMMNESYGFGSFRNKIWMKFHKDLSPEYQTGYHKLFLPLVNYSKKDGVTNKIIKKALEHIAVHSTIDMRQEARGKKHMLGRIYRKILEPICYWVGKYGKRT